MGKKEVHRRWPFNDRSNDLGTDRIVHRPENEEILKDFDKMPYSDLDHQKHRKDK
jgi:hypothetical protein